MAKSTVVSTLPFQLYENKPGLIPALYVIPPAEKDSISILQVSDGYHMVKVPLSSDKAPDMKFTDTSNEIARGIVEDFINSCLAVEMTPNLDGNYAAPGLFWVEGAHNQIEIMKSFSHRVKSAKANTILWFMRLVSIADDDWQRNHMHKTITDLQRHACRYLGLDREWNFDVLRNQTTLCWACKVSVNPQAIVCTNCRAILNDQVYKENAARFAKA